jgi:TRAP-type C4-dicarboxylate transport system substrate-binding protein
MDSLTKAGMNVVETDEAAFRAAVEPVYAKHSERFSELLKTIRELQ